MKNTQLAALFEELADIMEIAGEDHFKIQAYRRASLIILSSPENIADMTSEKLQQIPGIGKAIAGKIGEAKEKDTFATLEKWRQTGFASLRPLLGIPGLTARKLRELIKDLNISSAEDLKISIADGRLSMYDNLEINIKEHIIKLES
jgi:DNA polymerase (family X)